MADDDDYYPEQVRLKRPRPEVRGRPTCSHYTQLLRSDTAEATFPDFSSPRSSPLQASFSGRSAALTSGQPRASHSSYGGAPGTAGPRPPTSAASVKGAGYSSQVHGVPRGASRLQADTFSLRNCCFDAGSRASEFAQRYFSAPTCSRARNTVDTIRMASITLEDRRHPSCKSRRMA